jgi:hypothetical protein
VFSSFADGVEPFCLTSRSQQFGALFLSCVEPLLLPQGPRLALSSVIVLAFVCLLITCLRSLFIYFLFLSLMNW